MTEPVRIVALGQAAAGDDAAALHVLERLRHLDAARSSKLELISAPDPSRLVELLCHSGPVWIVDAVVGGRAPGQVLELETEMLSSEAPRSLSSHGMDVRQAIELCDALYPKQRTTDLRIVAISIEAPVEYSGALSKPVSEAVDRCAARLGELLSESPHQQEDDGVADHA